jgi:ornithine carbamoyltransferase
MVRTFGQEKAEELARYARVPVINGLTDLLHPCQVLADLQTVYAALPAATASPGDVRRALQGVRYAWIGDGNNMAASWIVAAGLLGLDLALACPEGFDPDPVIFARARATGRGRISITRDPLEAVAGRHVISTDVFTSMGQEAESEARRKAFIGFCVDTPLMSRADPGAIFLHCLPAHRGEEVSEEVLEGAQSRVWQQAENRLHTQKALLEFLLP